MKDTEYMHLLNIHFTFKNTYNLNIKTHKNNMPTKWHKKGGTAMLILEKVDFLNKVFCQDEIKETFTNQKRTNSFGRHNHRCIHLLTNLKFMKQKFYRTSKSWECGTPLILISKQVDKKLVGI